MQIQNLRRTVIELELYSVLCVTLKLNETTDDLLVNSRIFMLSENKIKSTALA